MIGSVVGTAILLSLVQRFVAHGVVVAPDMVLCDLIVRVCGGPVPQEAAFYAVFPVRKFRNRQELRHLAAWPHPEPPGHGRFRMSYQG